MEKVILMSNKAIPLYINKINYKIDKTEFQHESSTLNITQDEKGNEYINKISNDNVDQKGVKNDAFIMKNKEMGSNKNQHEQVLKISVLGERHTGTTWIWKHLDKCFSGKIQINRHLTRYKHWFQYDDGQKHEKTLVLSLFRDPYYWTMGMRKIPHHAPMHIYLPWQKFITKPWTMKRFGKDLNITNTTGRICQDKFYYNEVISCHKYPYPDGYFDNREKPVFSGHQPFYELRNDGSGLPFNNILELRTAKIRNFMDVKNYNFVHDAWNLKYEDLISQGTEALLQNIENVTGIKANCKPSPPQKNRWRRRLDPLFVKHLNDNLDWDVERSIGYDQIKLIAKS